ncbi:MAG: HD domain-containing phosphohydrolase [Pseudomonadota bacterium]
MALENRIPVDQLAVGIFVHLDLGWMEHPFSFNSFKIRSEEQLQIIRQLGLSTVRWSPDRSDTTPSPQKAPDDTSTTHAEQAVQPVASVIDPAIMAAKQARILKLQEHRESIARVEKEFIRSAKIVRSLDQSIFSLPDKALSEATELVGSMTDTLLSAPDLAIHVMGEHASTEEAYSQPLNVSVLSMLLARDLNLPAEIVHTVGLGALFHDIGLSQIPSKIVNNPNPLTKVERDYLELHCEYGVEIGKKAGLPAGTLKIIHQHHEFFDGTGYPAKLKGEAIYPLARIVSLTSAFESLCNPLNPALALTPHEALAQMFSQYRARFDPKLLKQFIRFMGVYPAGTVVSLSNGAVGMVIAVNTSHPLRPTVVVYDPDVPKREAIVLDLSEESEVNITRGIRPDQLLPAVFDYLSPRRRVSFFFDPGSQLEVTP